MKTLVLLISVVFALSASPVSIASGLVLGSPDFVGLTEPELSNGVWKVQVQVDNEEALIGLDLPIRFGKPGDPIELIKVNFTDRVQAWDFKHAAIDNENKTVMLGLISELGNARPNAGLDIPASGHFTIAELVFSKSDAFRMTFESFTTERPSHALMFYYNRWENGKPVVVEFAPRFEAEVAFKNAQAVPVDYVLSENYPNPFNPSTSFSLSLPDASDFSIRIYNITGQLVKTYSGHLEAGVHLFVWDGRNEQGKPVASGVYLYRAAAGSFSQTRKLLMVK